MVFMITGEDTLVPTERYIQIVSSIFDKNLLKIMIKLIKIEKKYTQDLTTNQRTFKRIFFNLFHKKTRFKIFSRRITTVSLLLDFKLQNIQQKDDSSIFTPRFQFSKYLAEGLQQYLYSQISKDQLRTYADRQVLQAKLVCIYIAILFPYTIFVSIPAILCDCDKEKKYFFGYFLYDIFLEL